ncbi:integrase, catalytic region, zinc finger, CCHC-type containing protein [Tanacetum coccineum]
MLLAMKDEAESNLKDVENDFMLDNSYRDETLKELTAAVIMMARIQPADDNAESEPSYDAKAVNEVNASNKVHEQVNRVKRKTIIHTSDDDQIDSNIIYDDPYVKNNGDTSEHDSNAHDEYHDIQMPAYNLKLEIRADKDTIERILKEKDKIESDFFKVENEKLIIQHETRLAKKAFKERENRYLDDICDLEEKLSSHDRIVYKMGQSIQRIHMLGKQPNKVYGPFLKAGLGYKNPEPLKKAIAAQQKMYHDEMLLSTNLKIDSPDSEETLEDAEETTQTQHQKEVDELIEHVNQKTYAYVDVWSQNQDLFITISELKNKIKTIEKGKNVNTKFDKSETSGTLLCLTPFPKNISVKAKKVSNTKVNADRSKPVTSHSIPKNKQSQKQSANVIARGMYRITKTETRTPDSKTNMNVSNSTGVESFNSVRRPKFQNTKSKDRFLKNTNDKRPSAHVWTMSSSVSIDSNKRTTMNSTVCQSNASVLNTKTVNVVNNGSNIVCVSCGKDVFLLSHEKCVARYDMSRDSKVKRALFTTLIAARSKNLGATSVVAKSRLSVAKTPTATNKVSSALPLSLDSSQSRTLSNYMKNKIATSRKWQKWFENQKCFNWTPKSKTAQSLPIETKSSTRVIQLVLWIVDSGCSKHMTSNMSLLRNFVEKFMGTVRFGNDHFTKITGYEDYVQGNLTICHVYYVEGLGHKLFSVGQFYDGDLEVSFRSNTCYVWNLEGGLLTGSTVSKGSNSEDPTDNGIDFKNEKLQSFYAKLGIVHHTSNDQTPQQNGIVAK